ncbi:Uma2 family endonuclease [Capnocytophaga canimorsus]|uniref:Uma2 family endonuclease n=1 Tax=Capnocytophaga canimorsus TaxID=28188 RepID=UPI0028EC0946|nr:Uma2 family endonuclease [Capnocytophaga canimorsus]MDT9498438.1 Uma2 family endonuclease [Capnocytophaga canimorsus]
MEITDINQLDLNKTYSYADYLLWKFKERVELFRGKILKISPAPSTKHQIISGNIHFELKLHFKEQACKLFSAPFDVRIPKQSLEDKDIFSVVQPDLCIICDLSKLDERGCIGAPDLVVEILSPSNSKKEMKEKFQLYEESGVKEYWIIDPNQESVLVNVLENGKYHTQNPIVDDDVNSIIFPNLKIHTDEIFKM